MTRFASAPDSAIYGNLPIGHFHKDVIAIRARAFPSRPADLLTTLNLKEAIVVETEAHGINEIS